MLNIGAFPCLEYNQVQSINRSKEKQTIWKSILIFLKMDNNSEAEYILDQEWNTFSLHQHIFCSFCSSLIFTFICSFFSNQSKLANNWFKLMMNCLFGGSNNRVEKNNGYKWRPWFSFLIKCRAGVNFRIAPVLIAR